MTKEHAILAALLALTILIMIVPALQVSLNDGAAIVAEDEQ